MTSRPRTFFERPRRLSRSTVWSLQRNFYDRQGVNAWKDAHIPFEISSNAYLSRRYAEVLLGFLRDARAGRLGKGGLDEPLLIVELGSGSGRLGYHVASELKRMTDALGLPKPAFRLVMTDFTENNLATYARTPRLGALADSGVLDFARFDVEKPDGFRLRLGGASIRPGEAAAPRPIVLIANYLFDTVRQDAFRIDKGVLYETRIGLAKKRGRAMPRRDDPDALDALDMVEEHVRARLPYYGDAAIDGVLASYAGSLDDCDMLFPIEALRCIDWFRRAAGGPLLALCGDKGYRTDAEMKDGTGAHLTPHAHGSFSTMVNFNAIERHARQGGGFAMHSPQADTGFTVSGFVFGAPAEAALETRLAFDDAMSCLGPRHFQTTFDELKRRWSDPSVPSVTALLRLANYDQDVFLRFSPVLTRKAGKTNREVRADLARALDAVWERYYPMSEDEPVAFTIGRVYYAMRRYDEARGYFERALGLEGDDAMTHYNIGLCHEACGRYEPAIEAYGTALARDRRYKPAAAAQARLQRLSAAPKRR
ncbi:MAG: tetratricopeptide repeat protein [Alphaproteobacteria bacterium]